MPKKSRQQEITKLRAEINKIETREQYKKKSMKQSSWFFAKINKIDKPLTKRQRENIQIKSGEMK